MITIKWSIFLNSWIIKDKNVSGIANAKPSSSGTMDPKKIPTNDDICQVTHRVKPEPNKNNAYFQEIYFP